MPGRRNRKPRPAQPEVAGVGGHDRVVGQDPAERRDRAARVDARAVPGDRRRRPTPPPTPPDPRRCASWRVATRAASSTARPSSRSLAALRNALASAATAMRGAVEPGAPARLEVDVRPGRTVARHRIAVRRRLVQPAPDDEQRVGGVEPLADGRGGAEAGHPEVERVVVRDDVAAAPAGDDRDLEELGEAGQLGRRPGAQDAGAGQDHRASRRGEELDDGAELLVGRARDGRPDRVEPGIVGASARRGGPRPATGGPGRAGRRAPARIASAIAPGTSSTAPGSAAHLASPPRVATWSISWNASRPRYGRSTWPTRANIGVESWRAVWIPMARLAAPTARVPRHTAGRPVSCPWASAMNAAAPSWRVATTRMPAAFERVEQAEEGLAGHGEGVPDAGRAERVGDEPADGPRAGVDDRLEVGRSHGVGRSGGVGGARRRARRLGSVGRRLGVGRRVGRRRLATVRPSRTVGASPAPPRPRQSCRRRQRRARAARAARPPRVRMRVRRRRPRWSARQRVRRRARS